MRSGSVAADDRYDLDLAPDVMVLHGDMRRLDRIEGFSPKPSPKTSFIAEFFLDRWRRMEPRFKISSGYLTAYYLAALLLIASLSVTAYFVLTFYMEKGKVDSTNINLLGRQRMLSQRILNTSIVYADAKNPLERKRGRAALVDVMRQFSAGHKYLLSISTDDIGLSPRSVADTKSSIAEVDVTYQALMLEVGTIAAMEPEAGTAARALFTLIENITAHSAEFLAAMDRTVGYFEELAQQRVGFHRRLELIIVGLVLLLLTAEALFIFRPMIAKVIASQKALTAANEQLRAEISARERTQRELGQVTNRAWQQEKLAAIGRLAAGIVHEIGNPLAALAGLVATAREELHQQRLEALDGSFGQIEENIRRLDTITRDVSGFSAPQAYEPELIDLNELVGRVAALMRYDSKLAEVELELDLNRELPAITGMPDQIWQVLMNLVLNAADAIEKKDGAERRITLTTDFSNAHAVLNVRDSGIGMSQHAVAMAFEPFHTTKAPGEGMGMGLALCYAFVQRHGGEISIDSTPGSGTSVSVTLPLA